MSKMIISEERLTLRARALCGVGALVVAPISGIFVFGPGLPLAARAFACAPLLIGLCLALLTLLGRRSPFLEALIDTLMSVQA